MPSLEVGEANVTGLTTRGTKGVFWLVCFKLSYICVSHVPDPNTDKIWRNTFQSFILAFFLTIFPF